MSSLPAELTYGKVIGRLLLAVGDTSADPDRLPDAAPALGTVFFTPKLLVRKTGGAEPAIVIGRPVKATVDSSGRLLDEAGQLGIWLVTGLYDVTYQLTGITLPGHDIEVLESHDDETPLDLASAMPPGGPVLLASQYAELTARVDALGEPVTQPGLVAAINRQAYAGGTYEVLNYPTLPASDLNKWSTAVPVISPTVVDEAQRIAADGWNMNGKGGLYRVRVEWDYWLTNAPPADTKLGMSLILKGDRPQDNPLIGFFTDVSPAGEQGYTFPGMEGFAAIPDDMGILRFTWMVQTQGSAYTGTWLPHFQIKFQRVAGWPMAAA